MEKFSYLKSANADYIDLLFSNYQTDPQSVDDSWRYFFEGLELGTLTGDDLAIGNGHGNGHAATAAAPATAASGVDLLHEARVAELINAYREFGHVIADIDPLNAPASSSPLLDLARFELTTADLSRTFQAGKLVGLGAAKLSDIIELLRATYCGRIAAETSHMDDINERKWLLARMESTRNREPVDDATWKHILKRLTDSESLEKFLGTRYVAQKRFSIEGGEATIPALDCIIETGTQLGASEFVIGMAHRGRLNVLVNLMGKKPEYLFTEFEGTYKIDPAEGEGDVKYHMGYSADVTTRQGKQAHLSLAFNPSHLEFVNPVVEGMARAKQTQRGDKTRTQVVPILIHGDAAFAGQGVCYETLNMSQLTGYATGGTLHLVINNQVGFTTFPRDSRSTRYSTDGAKMLGAPIFHVHGDHPVALWNAVKLCTEYRQKFKKDAFVDIVCYRKYGHNEGDEPQFTQPLMYKKIKAHATPRELFAQHLAEKNIVSAAESAALVDSVMAKLAEAQAKAKAEAPHPPVSTFKSRWEGFRRPTEKDLFAPVATTVPAAKLKEIAEKINRFPSGFQLHSKLGRIFEGRLKAVQEGKGIDWGNGEALAFASLLAEGTPVRLTGQDAERGTFTHRHAVLNDFETGEQYSPFSKLGAQFEVYNSFLSETAVMGFEFGFSISEPKALTIWEAQFGDFANGAQVIIDQFISTSESKWSRMSGLVLLLPHGFEGQGPEHSSARLERFLQLCGRDNMSVCNFTTPSQLFHALRRQVKRDFRKPMVLMTPKSLLRHPMAVSTLADFTDRGFEEVLDDPSAKELAGAKRVVLCSGKVYYDLLAEREKAASKDVALVRVEQLYPFPAAKLKTVLDRYSKAKEIVWCQEEPRNMGAWSFVFGQWMGGTADFATQVGNRPIRYVGREVCASPAVGSHKRHEQEQHALVEAAIRG